MAFTRKSIADHLDSYDAEISDLQDSKRETLDDYRAQLGEKGFAKAQIKAEIEALKRAMRRRRAIAKTSEAEVDEADDLADEIFVEITSPAPRATRVASDVPDHDPETGELTQTQEQPETTDEGSRSESDLGRDGAPDAGEDEASARSVHPHHDGDRDDLVRGSGPASTETSPDVSNSPSAADSLPGAVKAPEADSLPASGAVLPQSEIPAFLRKTIADYRPNCLHPDMCAASGLRHCNACQKAMEAAEMEVA